MDLVGVQMELTMNLEAAFQIANTVALAGWLMLALAPLAPRWADRIAGLAIPMALSVGYTGLVLAFWWEAPGGYGSLADVMALFTLPQIALAGWVHYLAFDLFIGGWEVRVARREGMPHLLVLPCLVLTFLFGPVGLLLFLAIRLVRGRFAPQPSEA